MTFKSDWFAVDLNSVSWKHRKQYAVESLEKFRDKAHQIQTAPEISVKRKAKNQIKLGQRRYVEN